MVTEGTPEWADYVGYIFYFKDGTSGTCVRAKRQAWGVTLAIKTDDGTIRPQNSRNIFYPASR